ncbi:MAG: dephospho-CoA kinase [Rikenellaceae bacterium]
MIKVAVTGGIGSGKSTLCDAFMRAGVPIYNADSEAKRVMSDYAKVRGEIVAEFGDEAYDEEGLNRAYLAKVVFGDDDKLARLNAIVHPAVKRDFEMWTAMHAESMPYVIMESAILFESGFDACVDLSVAVLAPEELRLQRVVNRDGVTVEQVRSRMAAQLSEEELNARADYTVVNIMEGEMDDAAQRLDQIFKHELFKRQTQS